MTSCKWFSCKKRSDGIAISGKGKLKHFLKIILLVPRWKWFYNFKFEVESEYSSYLFCGYVPWQWLNEMFILTEDPITVFICVYLVLARFLTSGKHFFEKKYFGDYHSNIGAIFRFKNSKNKEHHQGCVIYYKSRESFINKIFGFILFFF